MRRGLLIAALLAGALGAPALLAQSSAQGTTPVAAAAGAKANGQTSNDFITPKTASNQNLAAAEQEDEEYVFKHSASVRAIGRLFHLSPDGASLSLWFLNFLILAGAVGYFVVKGLPKFYRTRSQNIQKQLSEARVATEGANERLRIVEERLSRLDSEIAAIREGVERDTAGDHVRIQESLETERKKIVASAESEIAAAGAAAQRQLSRFAAELAVDRATARLRLSESDDAELIREFAASLGADGRHGGQN